MAKITGNRKAGKERYSKGWTERRIQSCLFSQYNGSYKYLLRNKYIFRPGHKQWESDMIGISKAKLVNEFEIKVSKSDFVKETKDKVLKHRFLANVWDSNGEWLLNPRYKPERKNSKEFRFTCPNYFFITCQEGLVSLEEVEDAFPYAGLKWVTDKGVVKTKLRKKLHPYKIDMSEDLLHKCYWGVNEIESRIWECQRNYNNLSESDLKNAPYLNDFMKKMFKRLKV